MSKFELIRREDGLLNVGRDFRFIEWDEFDHIKEYHKDIQIGRSVVIDPKMSGYKWMTSPITEIIENKKDKLVFRTENSTYTLYIYE